MGVDDRAEWWVITSGIGVFEERGGGNQSLSPSNEQLSVRESERFRVHVELLLPTRLHCGGGFVVIC
jgi:hypothetical protein